jgi:hypothetical protein
LQADPGGSALLCAAENVTKLGCEMAGIYGVEMRALAAEMAAHPAPAVTQVPVNEHELYARAYRKVTTPGPIYNAPNGQVMGNLDAGFNFVDAGREQDGWVEIRDGQWVPEKTLGPVNKSVSRFSGVLLPDGFPTIRFGWMLLDTKPSRTPGAKPGAGTATIKRYTLVNVFATQTIDTWEWYLIGPDQWVLQTRVATVKPVKRPEGVTGKWFAVDLFEQTLTAYQDDTPVFATLVSSGLPNWGTDEGLTKIWERHESYKMSGASGQPEFWYLPGVPYIMYFNKAEQALHGVYWHDGFGYRHSRGCVNLSMTDAKWAFGWSSDQPEAYVYVYHSAEYRSGAPQ